MVRSGLPPLLLALVTLAGAANITYDDTATTVGTIATFQLSLDPMYRRDSGFYSNITDSAFSAVSNLDADLVRYVPWFPYPRIAVAELFAPTSNATSWDWSIIDPIADAFFLAEQSRPFIFNFATIPEWMFVNGSDVPVPPKSETNIRDSAYEQGKVLRDPSFAEVALYFERLAKYFFTPEGFVDEAHRTQKRNSTQPQPPCPAYWEVLNEIESEHAFSPMEYTRLFDVVTAAVRAVCPNTKFVGLALGGHYEWDYYSTFLNASNHVADLAPDMISFHIYLSDKTETHEIDEVAAEYWSGASDFVNETKHIVDIRNKLSPQTLLNVNEIGCATQNMTDLYWNLCGATYAWIWGELASLQVDVLGMSQVIGYPAEFGMKSEWPCTSMIDWETGFPNARYWVLKLMLEEFASTGKKLLFPTLSDDDDVYAKALQRNGVLKFLLVNKSSKTKQVSLPGVSASERHVSPTTARQGAAQGISPMAVVPAGAITLEPFAVMVAAVSNP